MALLDAVLVAVWLGTLYSWRSIANSEYEKIRGAAAFIRREIGGGALGPVASASPASATLESGEEPSEG